MTDILEVWLEGLGHAPARVGLLIKEANKAVRFSVDESYIALGATRPILSSSWNTPGDEERTIARLRNTTDKVANLGFLPSWFSNLLPEGALRSMVEAQMPSGQADEYAILRRLGGDLPGAVVVRPAGQRPDAVSEQAVAAGSGAGVDEAGSEETGSAKKSKANIATSSAGTESAAAELPRLRFSLAGVQLKFSAMKRGERLTAPAAGLGHILLKLANENFPDLPEIEYSSMRLAAAAGINVSNCSLVPIANIDDVPARLLHGSHAIAIERFDRQEGGRVHIEDLSQVFQAMGDQKYSRANEESVINAVMRLANPGDAIEAIRRLVVNILIGNTDAHLKNTSFIYRNGIETRLSPAYDIVSIHLLDGGSEMALKFMGTRNADNIDLAKFERAAKYFRLTETKMLSIVNGTISRAQDTWPDLLKDLPLTQDHRHKLDIWWKRLSLTEGRDSPFS